MLKIIKLYFKFLSKLSATLAGHHAFHLFQIPLNKKIRKKEHSFYTTIKSNQIDFPNEPITYFEMGPKHGRLIFMVHGWESNAASLYGIAENIIELGFRVILFNLPAHGNSKLKKTNIKMSAEALQSVIMKIDPKESFSIIAHSFGSAVTSLALSKTNYHVDQLIFLTSPNSIRKIFEDYAEFIHLSKKGLNKLLIKAETILQDSIDTIEVETLLTHVKYNRLTLIHDQSDKIIPFSNSKRISDVSVNATLIELDKTGHYRMLWSPEVYDAINKTLIFKTLSDTPFQHVKSNSLTL